MVSYTWTIPWQYNEFPSSRARKLCPRFCLVGKFGGTPEGKIGEYVNSSWSQHPLFLNVRFPGAGVKAVFIGCSGHLLLVSPGVCSFFFFFGNTFPFPLKKRSSRRAGGLAGSCGRCVPLVTRFGAGGTVQSQVSCPLPLDEWGIQAYIGPIRILA